MTHIRHAKESLEPMIEKIDLKCSFKPIVSNLTQLKMFVIIATFIPILLFAYNKINDKINYLQQRIHDLHMKELMLNHRSNVLEDTVKQLEVNIMTLSLDLHAYEKKYDNLLCEQKNNANVMSNEIDKLVHEISTMRERGNL